MADLTAAETHFRFGENWSAYARHVDDDALREAEAGVLRLIPADKLAGGASFLDIGCGSGLHSLVAQRLGANVTAVDIDEDSVATAKSLLARFGAEADVRQQSVFDLCGSYDVVYSWGVLHHTGAMWRAVEHAASLVKPGGLFAIALYQKTPFCGAWKPVKRVYSASPKPVQFVIRSAYIAAMFARHLVSGVNPARYVREYGTRRGMNFFTDAHDWLGGYPYESATPDETVAFFKRLGFDVLTDRRKPQGLGLFGTGCDEFTFVKR